MTPAPRPSSPPPPPPPSWRKPAGVALILILILGWSLLVMSQAERIGALPTLVQAAIYLVAGIVWIAPLKPLLRWMEGV